MKKLIITAISLIIIGLTVFTGAFAALGFDFSKLNTLEYTSNTYTPEGEFDKIYIKADTADVEILPSQDGQCKVICEEKETAPHKVWIENGTLRIEVSRKKWYQKISFISIGDEKISVYLPSNEYASITVNTDTGNVKLPKDFTFGTIKLDTDTGDISCAAASENLVMTSDTGDVKLSGSAGKIRIESNTGDITLSDVAGKKLVLETDTGDVLLKNTVIDGHFEAESDTGDIEFKRFDATTMHIETDTGDVEGTLLSEKVFIVRTDTGDVDVPKSASSGKCEIETDTGDVEITIKK